MKTTTLNILNEIKNGNFYTLTKSDDDEVYEILTSLLNYNLLSKNGRGDFVINGLENIKNIEKLIELNDFSVFISCLQDLEKNKQKNKENSNNTYYNFENSQIGQFNDNINFENSVNYSSFEQNKKEDIDNSFKQKLWNLISKNPLISSIFASIIIGIISFIIKYFYDIDL